jgi:hypothetical protein
MAKSPAKTFKATLVRGGDSLNWTIASIPRSITDSWNAGSRPRVTGEMNGFAFRSTLFPTGNGDFTLLVTKRMQAGAKAYPGSVAIFRLEPDLEDRAVVMPCELKKAMAGAAPLRRWLDRLPYGFRHYIADNVAQPKSPEARVRRAERMAELLFSVMEGEYETPPILEAAFARQPLARQGWQKMTPTQRRGHLWGIFYYRGPESRQRRAAAAVEDAIRIAKGEPKPKYSKAASRNSDEFEDFSE